MKVKMIVFDMDGTIADLYGVSGWLEDLRASAGLILVSMGAGSVFNVLKKPQGDAVRMENYKKRAK